MTLRARAHLVEPFSCLEATGWNLEFVVNIDWRIIQRIAVSVLGRSPLWVTECVPVNVNKGNCVGLQFLGESAGREPLSIQEQFGTTLQGGDRAAVIR